LVITLIVLQQVSLQPKLMSGPDSDLLLLQEQ